MQRPKVRKVHFRSKVLKAWIKMGILVRREVHKLARKDHPFSLVQVRLKRGLIMKEPFSKG